MNKHKGVTPLRKFITGLPAHISEEDALAQATRLGLCTNHQRKSHIIIALKRRQGAYEPVRTPIAPPEISVEELVKLSLQDPWRAGQFCLRLAEPPFHYTLANQCGSRLTLEASVHLLSYWLKSSRKLTHREQETLAEVLYLAWVDGWLHRVPALASAQRKIGQMFYNVWRRESSKELQFEIAVCGKEGAEPDAGELYRESQLEMFTDKLDKPQTTLWFTSILLRQPAQAFEGNPKRWCKAKIQKNLQEAPEFAEHFKAIIQPKPLTNLQEQLAHASTFTEWYDAMAKIRRIPPDFFSRTASNPFQEELRGTYQQRVSTTDFPRRVFMLPILLTQHLLLIDIHWYKKENKLRVWDKYEVIKRCARIHPSSILRGETKYLFRCWLGRPMFTANGLSLEQDMETQELTAWVRRYIPQVCYGVPTCLDIDRDWVKGLEERVEMLHARPYLMDTDYLSKFKLSDAVKTKLKIL